MEATRVIAVFDVGKTNKKLFLFDEQYKIVFEKSVHLPESIDEDGDACENLESLNQFIFDSLREVLDSKTYNVIAVNFSAYGASFVYIDEQGQPLTPLYSYLKPYPAVLREQFYSSYGGVLNFSMQTSSPALGSLNSGLQLYRLKYEQPEIFKRVKYALHLPQYLAFLVGAVTCAELTSIGCHTALWSFEKNQYHDWLSKEDLLDMMAPLLSAASTAVAELATHSFKIGTGLHDSSAALIPYQLSFTAPFILISTGTWSISLNPFNDNPLTTAELKNDCLCYLSYKGRAVKASRLFAGHEHDVQVERIAAYFSVSPAFYKSLEFDRNIISNLLALEKVEGGARVEKKHLLFAERNLSSYSTVVEAYHRLLIDMIRAQRVSTNLVLKETAVKRIYVDGGFSRNEIYMQLMAAAFPEIAVFAAAVPEATALGAALAIHEPWNSHEIPHDLVNLEYSPPGDGLLI